MRGLGAECPGGGVPEARRYVWGGSGMRGLDADWRGQRARGAPLCVGWEWDGDVLWSFGEEEAGFFDSLPC